MDEHLFSVFRRLQTQTQHKLVQGLVHFHIFHFLLKSLLLSSFHPWPPLPQRKLYRSTHSTSNNSGCEDERLVRRLCQRLSLQIGTNETLMCSWSLDSGVFNISDFSKWSIDQICRRSRRWQHRSKVDRSWDVQEYAGILSLWPFNPAPLLPESSLSGRSETGGWSDQSPGDWE